MSKVGAKVLMVAHARQMYAGRALFPHDQFEANSEEDASDLETLGYAVRAFTAQKTAGPSVEPGQYPVPKGKYSRRDMRAKK